LAASRLAGGASSTRWFNVFFGTPSGDFQYYGIQQNGIRMLEEKKKTKN
jgi:hypothetical protein